MPAGITAQYGLLYQRYAFIKLALDNAGMDRFFVYEGVDDIDISEENRISAVRGYNNQFVQVKSGTVSRDCWAKVIGKRTMCSLRKKPERIFRTAEAL